MFTWVFSLRNPIKAMSYEDSVLILSLSFLFSLAAIKSTTTQSPGAITEHFTLNFTITNLMFTTDLQTPNSRKFRSAEKVMKHYVSQNSVVFHWNHPGFWGSHVHKDFSLPDWPPASEEQHWPPFHWLQSDGIQVSNNHRDSLGTAHLTDTLSSPFSSSCFHYNKASVPFCMVFISQSLFLCKAISVISAAHLRTVGRFIWRFFF